MINPRKNRRDVHGIVLLDKRAGISSNQALQEVKRLFNAAKAGHTGSLDPLATGLLPLCFGEATKVSGFMLDADKQYRVVVRLGVTTDTGDAEGRVLSTATVPNIETHHLNECLSHFTGEMDQLPPMYSALKKNGKKLYEFARAGITVERLPRRIKIHRIDLAGYENAELSLNVSCSKGTYIRSLAEDIGTYFGCGGTVIALRRLQAGIFQIRNALTIEQLRAMDSVQLDASLVSTDTPLESLPAFLLEDGDAARIRNGQPVISKMDSEGRVRLYHSGKFLGLGEIVMDGKIHPLRLFNL